MTDRPTPTTGLQRIEIDNLPKGATEHVLRALFLRHGRVATYERATSPGTHRPAPRAYIQMSPADASNAVGALQGHRLGENILRLRIVPADATRLNAVQA